MADPLEREEMNWRGPVSVSLIWDANKMTPAEKSTSAAPRDAKYGEVLIGKVRI